MTVALNVKEMYEHHGLWAKVTEDTGLDPRHLGRIAYEAGFAARLRPSTITSIRSAHAKVRPFPLNEHLREARAMLTELKASPGSRKLERYLTVLSGFLNAHDPSELKLLLEYKYMRMMVGISKALHSDNQSYWFGGREGWPEHLRVAEADAEDGMRIADQLETAKRSDKSVAQLRAIIFVNWTLIVGEQAKAGYANRAGVVMTPAQRDALFRKHNVLSKLKQLLTVFPNLWQAAYNGLELASTLQEDRFALVFYRRLRRLDRGFQDFDYVPGEAAAISQEPGMAYFHDKYRPNLHIPNKGKSK